MNGISEFDNMLVVFRYEHRLKIYIFIQSTFFFSPGMDVNKSRVFPACKLNVFLTVHHELTIYYLPA